MAEYNKVYASLKPELPKVIQQEQIYVYAPKSSRAGMKSITGFNITAPVAAVRYDTTDGITVTGNSSLVSEEVSGEILTQNFQSEFRVPIRPGKYIGIGATADNDAVEVKVDEAELNRNYYKITRSSTANVPAFSPNFGIITLPYSYQNSSGSLVRRGSEGEAKFTYGIFGRWNDIDGCNTLKFDQIYRQLGPEQGTKEIAPTTGDEGTLLARTLQSLRTHPLLTIRYKSQLYYRMDPNDAPDGTLNYVHIDSVQNTNDVYKVTGKCFSINVNTREWKVVDLDFGSSGSGNGIDSIEALNLAHKVYSGAVYGVEDGQIYNARSTIQYRDAETNKVVDKVFYSTVHIPIVGSDYVKIAGDAANSRFVVRLDDTALALDYIKLDKTKASAIPQNNSGVLNWLSSSIIPTQYSLVQRDVNGNSQLNALYAALLVDKDAPYQQANMNEVYRACRTGGTDQIIDKTFADTGTMSADLLAVFTGTPNSHIIYDNQLYYRMDPANAPNGTLNFIHFDSIEDGDCGYKATGKCFSITVSTRDWQVVDLDFGGSTRTTHNLTLTDSSTGMSIYFSLTNNRPETYEGAPVGLWVALQNSPIACTVDANGIYSAGMITVDGDNFRVFYGNSEEVLIELMLVRITDSLV